MFNLNNDYDLQPMTYSIKSYRRRESSIGKKIAKIFVGLIILTVLAIAAFLSFLLVCERYMFFVKSFEI